MYQQKCLLIGKLAFRPKIVKYFKNFILAKKSLTTHQRNMHGISPTGFMCHKCNKLLKSKEEEIKHEEESHGKDLFCEKCNIAFENLMSFNDHLNACLDEPKNFNCKKCNNPSYTWYSPLTLQWHWAEEHKLHRDKLSLHQKCLNFYRKTS